MKRKLLACTALVLCLALLCGCTSIATSEWMQDLFPVGDEAVAAQQTGSVEDSTAEQEVKQVVTETYTELDAFGLAYQPDYGLQPYNCQSLNNRIIFSFLYEPLFAVTDGYEAEPILADSYLVTDDGKTTTVKLRSGVTFHDGTAMTAADAAYSIASAMGSEYYGSRLRFCRCCSISPSSRPGRRTTQAPWAPARMNLPTRSSSAARTGGRTVSRWWILTRSR